MPPGRRLGVLPGFDIDPRAARRARFLLGGRTVLCLLVAGLVGVVGACVCALPRAVSLVTSERTTTAGTSDSGPVKRVARPR